HARHSARGHRAHQLVVFPAAQRKGVPARAGRCGTRQRGQFNPRPDAAAFTEVTDVLEQPVTHIDHGRGETVTSELRTGLQSRARRAEALRPAATRPWVTLEEPSAECGNPQLTGDEQLVADARATTQNRGGVAEAEQRNRYDQGT